MRPCVVYSRCSGSTGETLVNWFSSTSLYNEMDLEYQILFVRGTLLSCLALSNNGRDDDNTGKTMNSELPIVPVQFREDTHCGRQEIRIGAQQKWGTNSLYDKRDTFWTSLVPFDRNPRKLERLKKMKVPSDIRVVMAQEQFGHDRAPLREVRTLLEFNVCI